MDLASAASGDGGLGAERTLRGLNKEKKNKTIESQWKEKEARERERKSNPNVVRVGAGKLRVGVPVKTTHRSAIIQLNGAFRGRGEKIGE
jgi:hypothetical protein